MPILRDNRTILQDWVWRYIWILPDSRYTLNDLPHIALETEALAAYPDATEQRFYLDYVISGDNGNVFVHMDTPVLH